MHDPIRESSNKELHSLNWRHSHIVTQKPSNQMEIVTFVRKQNLLQIFIEKSITIAMNIPMQLYIPENI